MLHPIDGFLNLNKPPDWTSHDCVARVRRLLRLKRVGHGGTLDPAATGVLPIALGRATRLLQYLPDDKAYRAVIRFGVTTATDDLAGEILSQQPVAALSRRAVEQALPTFVGTIQQMPPRYSAVQVQGKRLYERARKGETVEIPHRTVTVHTLRVLDWQAGPFPELTLAIDCGAGTYIRSIARDLGETLGTGATLAELLRTRSSGFRLDTSVTLADLEAQLEAGTFQPIAAALPLQSLMPVTLAPEAGRRWCQGQRLLLELSVPTDQPLRVLSPEGMFLGIGMLVAEDSGTLLIPKMVFAQEMPEAGPPPDAKPQ
jgi:tRNA pseudouridine55 synthase